MALPSLSEILGQPTSPDLSTTPQGTVIDLTQGADKVFQAAAIQQKNDWDKYVKFTDNLQNFMADAAKVRDVDMAPQDRDVVMGELATFLKDAGNNLEAIANPLSNPAAYQSLTQKGAEVMSLAVKSKNRAVFDKGFDTFIRQNPEWNTKKNKDILQSSYQTDIKQWQPYQLSGPMPAFDINALADWMNQAALTKDYQERVGGKMTDDGKVQEGNEYLYKYDITRYDPTKFDQAFEAVWQKQDQYGNMFSDWADNFVWQQLDPEKKADYTRRNPTNPQKEATLDFMRNFRKPDQSSVKTVENEVWKEKLRAENELKKERIRASASRGPAQAPRPTGNALDSIRDNVFNVNGTQVTLRAGRYTVKDTEGNDVPYEGKVRIPRSQLSEELVTVIGQASPNYFGKAGTPKTSSTAAPGYVFNPETKKYELSQPQQEAAEPEGALPNQFMFEEAVVDVVGGVPQAVQFVAGGKEMTWVNRGTLEGTFQGATNKKVTKTGEAARFGSRAPSSEVPSGQQQRPPLPRPKLPGQ